jgi:hypothetical protein
MPRSAGEFLEDMNAMQHQSMLARLMSSTAGASPDLLAGGIMSRVGAVGRPLLSGAMSMLDLDPMSLGLRAGMFAWGSGAGVLGAGLTGMGFAAGAGIIGAGAAFVGNQMYSGAQQQLLLNQGLRQNFNFVNSQGGMGFTSQQGFQIGSHLRDMTHQFGPLGEVTTFGELSRLAINMGRMGFAQNVRSVSEFKDKFKEMIDTLKKVATDMGSSLEEAQKFVQSMRGSGIFQTADQLRMSSGTRLVAAAGGLAMSEVTGMANIGSQIARAVGGLGRQGAFGGMKTIEQIGLAQRVGAISEEDIYNATGLTGAEGRQALATAQMQQSARFLSTARGRRFLASIAGKDGHLDEAAVMEYLMGGNVTTGRTMELAYQNLRGVGRANFIRNEGRLRGAALERFGGLLQSMIYQQWLASRGYDPMSMDDKAMLAFQRFSGLGRDEADLAIKQLQRLPEMMREMQHARAELAYSDELNKYRKSVGVEGMKRRFDQAREHLQGKLQQAGADILNQGSDMLAQWFNRMMGVYERHTIEGIDQVLRLARDGHADAARQMDRLFAGSSVMPGGNRLGASYGVLGGGGLSAAMRLSNAHGAVDAAQATSADIDFMKIHGARFRVAFVDEAAGLKGLARADKIMEIVRREGGADARALLREYESTTDPNKKLQIAARMEKAAGFSAEAGIGKTLTAQSLNINDSGQTGLRRFLGIGTRAGATQAEVDKLIGESRIQTESLGSRMASDLTTSLWLNMIPGGFGSLIDVGRRTVNYFGEQADAEAAGAFMRSREGRTLIGGIMEGSGSDYNAAMNRLAELKTKGELGREDKAQFEMLQTARAARELGLYLDKTGKSVDQLTDSERSDLAAKASKIIGREVSFDELLKSSQMSIAVALDLNRQAAVREMRERTDVETKAMRTDMVASGMAILGPDGQLTIRSGKLDELERIGGKDARAAYELAVSIAETTFDGDTDRDAARLRDLYGGGGQTGKYAELRQKVSIASVAQKRALARALGGADPIGQMYAASAAREERLQNQIKRTKAGAGRVETAMASLLGINVDKDLRRELAEGSVNQAAALIMQQQGIRASDSGAESYQKQLIAALSAAREGKMGVAADALSAAESDAFGEVKKKLEKYRDSKMSPAEQSAKYLSKMADNSDEMKKLMQQQLSELQALTKKDNPDGQGKSGSGSPGATQPGG